MERRWLPVRCVRRQGLRFLEPSLQGLARGWLRASRPGPVAEGGGLIFVTHYHGGKQLNVFNYAVNAANGDIRFQRGYGNQWGRYNAPVTSREIVFMAG